MKHLVVSFILILSGLCLQQCGSDGSKNRTQQPTTAPPLPGAVVQAPARVVPDSEYCSTIASRLPERRAVGMKGKYWTNGQTLRIGFTGGSAARRKYVTDAFAEWAKVVNLNFSYPDAAPYDIRIAFSSSSGSWSYVGTDCRSIPASQVTMNIGWSGLDVCLHEIGHALGMAHEQASPNQKLCWNKDVVYAALAAAPNYWDKATVDYNVFRTLSPAEADATAWDSASIMQYSIPASWLCAPSTGIEGGKVLSETDKKFMSEKYPRTSPPPAPPAGGGYSIQKYQRDSMLKWINAAKIL